ncbi:unnamed protein product [Rhodiola kirilowii]
MWWGKPRLAHWEGDRKMSLVSQFVLELQGLKTVDGEDPPRILHLNPRLKGDWSRKPAIEMNTCYRMQWGTPQRCEGLRSKAGEDTVDGLAKCEKWISSDDTPGFEGYHLSVDGRHISSFPYRTSFALEDATGLWLNGDVDVHLDFTASLPSSHPSNAPQKHLEMLEKWKAPAVLESVELFIGVLSAGNHFAERMAVRKSWMQHKLIRSSRVVARFFVALHARNEVNVELKKEAEYFAICEHGVRTFSAHNIMKCDDDTFVRVDAVLYGVRKLGSQSFYAGNMNYHHKALRHGKWAVTRTEWPDEAYPALFKMEDVSMGMWGRAVHSTKRVKYLHTVKFCQFGCIANYITAHYQSPRQMMCMWEKLQYYGKPLCCNI